MFNVEVDLVFFHPREGIVLCEVKSNRAGWSLQDRLTRRQIARLYSVYLKLHSVVGPSLQFQVVTVGDVLEIYDLRDLM